ncbi:MAG TPA: Mth938-like domain-containing protein [Paracoccaceae bacterium]|nr:Mth938-like domain-containing protein [Paracoccaceae bacterium]
MRMNEISFETRPPIDGYGEGGFRIGGMVHHGSVLLLPRRMDGWDVAAVAELDAAACAPLVEAAAEIDVLLVGTGAEIAPIPRAARAALEAAGLGVEVMATGPACRTFNVLLAEDRRVAAALIAV